MDATRTRPPRLYRRAKIYVRCRCGRGHWIKPAPWLRIQMASSSREAHRVVAWVECQRPDGCGHDVPVTVGDIRSAQ